MQYRHEREQSEPAGTCEKQRYCSFSLSTAAGRGQRERARFHAYTASKRIYFFKFLHFAGEAIESVPHLQTHTASERALKTKRETIFVQFLFFSWPNFRKSIVFLQDIYKNKGKKKKKEHGKVLNSHTNIRKIMLSH